MKKKLCCRLLAGGMAALLLAGCGNSSSGTVTTADSAASSESSEAADTAATEASTDTASDENVEIQVFIAASLSDVMDELASKYQESHPNVTITFNADASGKLMTQIEEGYACDVFFSAAQKQMDELGDQGLVVDGTRHNVVNNQLVVITYRDSGTKVTGLENIGDATSIALADGSVPVGKYTRVAMVNAGLLESRDDPSTYTTEEISEALGGVEISEQSNVSKVLSAVSEHSCEVGTTYYSDVYGHEDDVDILQTVSYDLSGNIIYPIAQIVNDEATEAETQAAEDFEAYVLSDGAKDVFTTYQFDTNVTD